MASWLDKALGKRSETIVKPTPFMRKCPCGTNISGIRQDRARRMICSQCGEPHFILPVNLYPESERIHFKALELGEFEKQDEYDGSQMGPASDPEMALDMEDSVDEPSAPDRYSMQKLARDEDSVDEPLPQADYVPPSDEFDLPDEEEEPIERIAVPSPREERAGQRHKLLLVGMTFFMLVGGMAVWALWDSGQENAELNLQTARDAGMIAMESGDFGEARRQFGVALEALDTLGVTGERRDSIQRLWQEADTILGLTNRSLDQLVSAAQTALSEVGEEEWAAEFKAIYSDAWIVVDQSPLQVVSRGPTEGRRLELLWTLPDDPDSLPIHLAGVERILSQTSPGETQRIVFAGQLAGCRREADAWVIELNPDSAFLWRRMLSLEQLGLALDDDLDLQAVIHRQSQLSETTELATAPAENPDAT